MQKTSCTHVLQHFILALHTESEKLHGLKNVNGNSYALSVKFTSYK